MKKKILTVLIFVLCFAVFTSAGQYRENFEGFYVQSPLEIVPYGSNWEVNSNFDVVATADSGSYYGGYALTRNSASDSTTAVAVNGIDFGLAKDGDGIEYGFDIQMNSLDPGDYRVFLRTGSLLSVSCGTQGDKIIIRNRPGEWGGTVIEGTTGLSSYYQVGDWLNFRVVLTGTNWDTVTVYVENLTTGVSIPSGITNVSVDENKSPDWDRLNVRTANVAGHVIDNIYVKDYYAGAQEYYAIEPTPLPGTEGISVDGVQLSWAADPSASSSRVYFGSNPYDLTMIADTTDETLLVTDANLYDTRYHWLVNQVVGGQEYPGYVWSFTTEQDATNRVIAYEGFDYDAGQALSSFAPGGTGWLGGWQGDGTATTLVTTGSGSLDAQMTYPLTATGNKVEYISGHWAFRKLKNGIDLGEDKDYYISYLVELEVTDVHSSTFGLYQSGSSSSSWAFRSEMFYEGYPGYDSPKFFFRKSNNTGIQYGTWEANKTYMIIARIQASSTGDDEFSFAIYDKDNPLPVQEPASWDVTFTDQLDGEYSWVAIKGRADAFSSWKKDEIYAGLSWGAVTGHPPVCGDPFTIMPYDLMPDCVINLNDFAVFAQDWLGCTDPAQPGCFPAFSTTVPLSSYDDPDTDVFDAQSSIVIDGDLSEWTTKMIDWRFDTGYNTANAADINDAVGTFAWDPANPDTVYAAFVVTDTSGNFIDNPANWNDGDNIEIRFSVNDSNDATQWYDDETFDTAQYYQFGPKASGGGWSSLGPVAFGYTPAADYTDIDYAVSVDGDKIIYEMAIPAYLSYDINTQSGTLAALAAGDNFAFNIQFNSVNNDIAGISIDGKDSWSGVDWYFADTQTSGTYTGGKAVSVSAHNVWASRLSEKIPVDPGAGPIEMSVDVQVSHKLGLHMGMRAGTPDYGPTFGIDVDTSDNTLKFMYRDVAFGGTTYGSAVSAAEGEWIRITMSYDTVSQQMTLTAHNLTTDTAMTTGITNVSPGAWTVTEAGIWFRHLVRLSGGTQTVFDNIDVEGTYVEDFEGFSLSGALFNDQAHTPSTWYKLTLKEAQLGDWGYLDADFQQSGEVNTVDLSVIAKNWLDNTLLNN